MKEDFESALQILQLTFATFQDLYGIEDGDALKAMYWLATCYMNQEKLKEVET
jgi:TolA-binding protein